MIGLLRLLLAAIIVGWHTNSYFGLPTVNHMRALLAFFVISGFFISLVLCEKYNDNRAFWANRIIRLYPIYFASMIIVLIASTIGYLVAKDAESAFNEFFFIHPDSLSRLILIASNLGMMVGPLNFISPNLGLNHSGFGINYFSVIPVSWSLMPELIFYLIAPWLVRMKTTELIYIGCISYLLKYPIEVGGWGYIPWVYINPVTNMMYFIMGILAYRAYKRFEIPAWMAFPAIILVLAVTIGFQYLPGQEHDAVYPMLVAISLPFLFKAPTQFTYLGLISYPVFLLHWTIFYYMRHYIDPYYIGLVTLVTAIVTSIILVEITKPLEKWKFEPTTHTAPHPLDP